MVIGEAINDGREEARGVYRLDMGLDDLAQLLGNSVRCVVQGIRLHLVHIKEYASEDDSQSHEHLVLGENTPRILVGLQGQREEFGGEMNRRQVSKAVVKTSQKLGSI